MRHILPLSLGLTALACTTTPEKGAPFVQIVETVPSLFQTVFVDDPERGQDFRLTVKTQGVDAADLNYFWYLDWLPGDPTLDLAAICGNKPTCTVNLCARNREQRDHTVLAVVSNVPLAASLTPTVFPSDAAFDAVEWRLRRNADCPGP